MTAQALGRWRANAGRNQPAILAVPQKRLVVSTQAKRGTGAALRWSGVRTARRCCRTRSHTQAKRHSYAKRFFCGTWHRRGPRREAGKRSGKNLVFPRGPAAALASDMIVISALCRNNTPPMAQEGPSGSRRWEVRCPDDHIFFACVRCFCPGKERNGSSVTLALMR